MRHHKVFRFLSVSASGAVMALSGLTAWADEELAHDEFERRPIAATHESDTLSDIGIDKHYALGIGRFDLDSQTEIIGWRLNQAWYFGRQDGIDSGLTLVWQQAYKQISLSKDGLRLTQRF